MPTSKASAIAIMYRAGSSRKTPPERSAGIFQRVNWKVLSKALPSIFLPGSTPPSDADEANSAPRMPDKPISLKRRGNEQRLIVDSGFAPMRTLDPALVDPIAKAHLPFGKLIERPDTSIIDVAKSFGIDRADTGRILPPGVPRAKGCRGDFS